MKQHGKHFCDVCGERVDKSDVKDHEVVFGVFSMHMDKNPEQPRQRKSVLLCKRCTEDLRDDLLSRVQSRVKMLEEMQTDNPDLDFHEDMQEQHHRVLRLLKRTQSP